MPSDHEHVVEYLARMLHRNTARELGVMNVFDFATAAHDGGFRKDGVTPYIHHPARVMDKLAKYDVTDPAILSAALLHDVVEDTNVTLGRIRDVFGDAVADIVQELTKDKTGDKAVTRKEYVARFKTASPKACLIKLVDRADNLNDWAGMDAGYKPAYTEESINLLENIRHNEGVLYHLTVSDEFWVAYHLAVDDLRKACGVKGFEAQD